MNNRTVSDIVKIIKTNLSIHYSDNEIQSFIYLIFEYLLNYTKIDLHINSNATISQGTEKQINEIIKDLKNHKPVQYIFGKTEFYGLQFSVSPGVLIPRQETEELVDWIIKDEGDHAARILDIGTGCGCIAVALARFIAGASVDAIDISAEAVELAGRNALMNKVSVNFMVRDILNIEAGTLGPGYDIIVSNPPYVRESEKKALPDNVRNYEPAESLFVPDNDPLVFYRVIAEYGLQALKDEGRLYFELNENLGDEVCEELARFNYKRIGIKNDISGKKRMVRAFKI
jgi:release factor glutamine methyltransferase